MERKDIIRAVMEKEYQISPEAVELIYSSNFPEDLLKYVLSTVNDSIIVIGTENIDLEGFATYGKASKLTYVENEKNLGLETSAGNLVSNKTYPLSPEEREYLSRASTLPSRSDNPSSKPDSFSVPNSLSESALSSEPDIAIASPDPILKSSQDSFSDSISIQDMVPDKSYEPSPNTLDTPDTQSDTILSE